ncbi:hypothetical protein DYB28_014452 [Aphanomyces astaci]|uniref:Uncharacterized protein n=1 Tax=Aphanomyces astaci TaxID=112090 RepID=A0A9X8DRM1_APHAT|nr:hypothetical protein DYB28_014452 [Aphanomyces astaci]
MAFKTKEEARLLQQTIAQAEWTERSAMEASDEQSRRREAHDAKVLYAIDCLIRSHEIPTLVRGVHCLIQDVHAVRSQKQSSLARQRSSQANQQSIQATLDDTSRMYHNLLRVLQRAEDENVIAKPEAGGTVRLIPATAQGMRLLRDKINALHQEVRVFRLF